MSKRIQLDKKDTARPKPPAPVDTSTPSGKRQLPW